MQVDHHEPRPALRTGATERRPAVRRREGPPGGQRSRRSREAWGPHFMIATLLFAIFIITMLMGVPIGAALGLAG
ncbi:MAG: hypothetical protein KDF57_14235, partial [Ottowia sp.]|nr:hypothetical protein [Ottowia sp.]